MHRRTFIPKIKAVHHKDFCEIASLVRTTFTITYCITTAPTTSLVRMSVLFGWGEVSRSKLISGNLFLDLSVPKR